MTIQLRLLRKRGSEMPSVFDAIVIVLVVGAIAAFFGSLFFLMAVCSKPHL